MRGFKTLLGAVALLVGFHAGAQTTARVEDIPTRPGVTQRAIVLSPDSPKAAVVLFAGGHGGLQVFPNGSMKVGDNNFLVRTRQLFADEGLTVVVLDAPSDRQRPPYLGGFRQTAEHAADVKAVIAWLRARAPVPVWLVGHSRGNQSAAFVATALHGAEGPDGIVLTSTILSDVQGRAVPALPLDRIKIPVLIVHHELDGCQCCRFADMPQLTSKLTGAPRQALLTFKGGNSRGDPCETMAYHSFNGLEAEVVRQIAAWILAPR